MLSKSFPLYRLAIQSFFERKQNYVVTIDYRVRGFTRDVDGVKHYIDHAINSIQNYMTEDTKEAYQMMDVNVYQENLFHTKMMLKETDLNTYLFGVSTADLSEEEEEVIYSKLTREMQEIFYGRNLPDTE